MELVELSSIEHRCRGSECWSCEGSSSGDAWVVVAKQPLVVRLKPKVHNSTTRSIMDSVVITAMNMEDEDKTLGRTRLDTKTMDLSTMSNLLLRSETQAVPLSWARQTSTVIHQVAWSPENSQVFAVLTNTGHVALWDAYAVTELSNVSDLIVDLHYSKPLNLEGQSFHDLKDICETLLTSAICWSEKIYKYDGKTFTYLVTVSKKGKFYIWSVVFHDAWKFELKLDLAFTFESNLKNVTSVYWINRCEGNLLVYGNALGQIQVSMLNLSDLFVFELQSSNLICEEMDRLKVERFFHTCRPDNLLCLIFVKLSYIIIAVLDSEYKVVLEKTFHNLSNVRITGVIKMHENDFAISTLTGTIFYFKLRFNSENNSEVTCEKFITDVNFDVWALHGMSFTKNRLICIMYLTPCKTVNRHSTKVPSKVVFSYLKLPNYMNLVFDNKNRLLTDYWDCLELCRLLDTKSHELPANWPVVFVNGMSPYETKVCMWLNIINSSQSQKQVLNNELLYLVIFNHVKKSLTEYVNNTKVDEFSEFQYKTISSYIKFLKNYDGNIPSNDLLDAALSKFESKVSDIELTCDWCDEEIKGILCSQNHPRQWCCITLQDIGVNCLVCPLCGSLAHPKLCSQNPICTFCDFYMIRNNSICENKEM